MDHPRKDEHGKPVHLKQPSTPTPLTAWGDSSAIARVVPDGDMPASVCSLSIDSWREAPTTSAGWEALAGTMVFDEPPFTAPPGFKRAAGAVVLEPDGRVWVVAPSNGYAGYAATFAKGGLDGRSAKAAALVEVFEESGLQVELTGHLVDAKRTLSYTRYYLARRLGGNPADMGWETQAVLLAPRSALASLLTHKNDLPVIEALKAHG
jgi:ADP-ribose pyrophosphatase YjhB (NUDIX family)